MRLGSIAFYRVLFLNLRNARLRVREACRAANSWLVRYDDQRRTELVTDMLSWNIEP